MSLLKIIRSKCLDCCGGIPSEVRQCTSEHTCALWPYRMGTRPDSLKRHISEAHLAKLRAGRERHITETASEGISP